MKHFILLFLLTSGLWARPNVLIIMTDDQGYPELSVHGNPVLQTPNLDRLHGQSVRFSDYHVSPMCTPTRGQLLTGMDAARNGAVNVSSGRALLRPENPTIANYFAEAGYATGVFGKWHLGANYPFRPQDRGFQESVWYPSSSIPSVPAYWGNDYFDDVYRHNGRDQRYNGYCTDVFFDETKRFILEAVKEKKPFLCYLATNTPHGPFISKEEDQQAIAEILTQPKFNHLNQGLKNRLSLYLGMIRNIDWNMGKLMRFLDDQELSNDTILLFQTDNGSLLGPQYFNAGMRGKKTEIWEGGHRVPCFIRWPGGDLGKPRDIGGLTQVQDILPTLMELCSIAPKKTPRIDGISLVPFLKGAKTVPEDRILVINYSRMPGFSNYPSPHSQTQMRADQALVLWKRWRLLENRELYDLGSDPMQRLNVIDKHPEVVAKMRKHLFSWWEGVKHLANEEQRIIVGTEYENPTKLSATEWLDVFIDQQRQILRGDQKSGYWLIDVARAGEYEVELRRWPKESEGTINGTLPDGTGTPLPITQAMLYVSGHNHLKIAQKKPYSFEGLTKKVHEGDKAVTFTLNLKKGPTALHTWFKGRNNTMLSAYYVYLKRTGGPR
ncbi:MAG: sulfatase-like hydrolase/transferase [Verrucomicrobiales bacterium]|nr:sulfatase-like hydrolase/transferase [Verrucomicrobiales bacterium]